MAVKREFFMAFFRAIFCGVFCALMSLPAFGTNPDNREYVDWKKYPEIVLLSSGIGAACTGQFVAPNLILTAAHCSDTENPEESFRVYMSDGNSGVAKKIARGNFPYLKGMNLGNAGAGDWMFLLVENPQFYSGNWYEIYDIPSDAGFVPVENVGFGSMRVLTDDDIKKLKEIYKKALHKGSLQVLSSVESEMAPELFKDTRRLKRSSCNVIYNVDCKKSCKDVRFLGIVFKEKDSNCESACKSRRSFSQTKNWPNALSSTCYTVQGNSGGPYVVSNAAGGKSVAGVVSGGMGNIYYDDNEQKDFGFNILASSVQFKDVFNELKKKYPADASVLCTQEELAALGAKRGIKKEGKCAVVDRLDCLDGRNFNDKTGKCEEFVLKCTPNELSKLNAVSGQIRDNGKCFPTECVDTYVLQGNVCVAEQSLVNNNASISTSNAVNTEVNTETKSVPEQDKKYETSNIEPMPRLDVFNMLSNMNKAPAVESENLGNVSFELDEKALGKAIEQMKQEREQAVEEADKVIESVQESDIEDIDVVNITSKLEVVHDYDERIKKLEEDYKNAKERETSVANRILSGATIAATGLGGMELAQGIAEQSVDKDAAADMAAYMATFQCKIGDNGNKINGGDMGVTTPGANQLINLYQSYVDLAASVKARKADLGLRPGIEADVVLDKSATGLYDDKGNGVQNGTYASLYRAARGNQSDIDKLAEQSDASTNRVQIGGTAAGVGAVGGAVGNVLINKDGVNPDQNILQQAAGLFLGK